MNTIEEIQQEALSISRDIDILKQRYESLLRDMCIYAYIQPGNLVEGMYQGEVSQFVCSSVKVMHIKDRFRFVYTFLKRRKNSENSFRQCAIDGDMISDIKVIDNERNYLTNLDRYDVSLF